MQRNRRPGSARLLALLALPLVLLITTIQTAPSARAGPPTTLDALAQADHKDARLDSALASLSDVDAGGRGQAAEDAGLQIVGDTVQVIAHIDPAQAGAARRAVAAVGGRVTKASLAGDRLQGFVPIAALRALATDPAIQFLQRPERLTSLSQPRVGQLTSEGVGASNANTWHTASQLGAGVKVAIIDGGFEGYAGLLGSDLPASVTALNFADTGTVADGGPHGTACAEIVSDMAPGATLYLLRIQTNLDLQEAVSYSIANGIQVISTSLGWYNLAPGDGTGFFADEVARARSAGIVWATAAGNDRENHWGGLFTDSDGDKNHEFAPSWEINCFAVTPGGDCVNINPGFPINALLRWDNWSPPVSQDYDLYIVRWSGSAWQQVSQGGTNVQNGGQGQTPTEYATAVTSGSATAYGVAINRYSATRADVNLELFVPGFLPLRYTVPARSLANLADSPGALTVAALDVSSPYPQESYSSEGPTNGSGGAATGGALKPDIAAFANVNTRAYGSTPGEKFNGTSSATPHVAGAAALVRAAFPSYTVDQVRAFLTGRAVDMGAAGLDTQFGAGRLFLGAPPQQAQPGTLQLGAASYQAAEGGSASISLTRTGGSDGAVSAVCATATGGAATSGADYTPVSQRVVFADGDTAPKTCQVPILDDTLVEGAESFTVVLRDPEGGAALGSPTQATVQIQDTDLPALSITDMPLLEGNSGDTEARLFVRLSVAGVQPVTVRYRTVDGSATAPEDYTAIPLTTLTFQPGQLEQAVVISVTGDLLDEPDETFSVELSDPVGATLADGTGEGTIINDDSPQPTLLIDDAHALEGGAATFTVRLSVAGDQPATVRYRTVDSSAVAPDDYTAITPTTLTFEPGQVEQTIVVSTVEDLLDEPDETFSVELSEPVGAALGRSVGTGTIYDDDLPLTLSISDVAVLEGRPAVFQVSLSATSANTITVGYHTAEYAVTLKGVATPGADYAITSGTLTFAPGETSRAITITVIQDDQLEPDETFAVVLEAPTGATIADGAGVGTILNEDDRYTIRLPLMVNPEPPPPPDPWRTIVAEDFEGSFPGVWQLSDRWGDGQEHYWSRRTCRAASGAHSGWAVGGGANGATLACGSLYPNNAESWMVFGPFSLADTAAADLRLKLWLNSELNYDGLCRMASVNGRDFSGYCTSGATGGWIDRVLDLTSIPDLGNLAGRQSVWIAIVFSGDATVNRAEGAYIDDIVLRKYVAPGGAAPPSEPAATAAELEGALVEAPARRVFQP